MATAVAGRMTVEEIEITVEEIDETEESGETDSLPTNAPIEGDEVAEVEGAGAETEEAPELTPEQMIADLQARLDAAQAELAGSKKWEQMIAEQSAAVERQAGTVLAAESALKQAKGLRDSQKEKYDGLVVELRGMVRDFASGQQRLDFDADGMPAATVSSDGTVEIHNPQAFADALQNAIPDPAISAAISELGTKIIRSLIGGEEFARAKELEDPVGLTDKQVGDLESAEIATVADLEKQMRENDYWWRNAGLGEKTMNRVVSTLRVWRERHPHSAPELSVVPADDETGEEDDDDDSDNGDEDDSDGGSLE